MDGEWSQWGSFGVCDANGKKERQAGAELCQAQVKLRVIVYIGVKVEVEIVVKV